MKDFSRMKGPECIHERTKTITGERIHQKYSSEHERGDSKLFGSNLENTTD